MTDFSKIKALFHIEKPHGYTEDDLIYWRSTYGSIPQVLIDYYLELGAHEELNHAQDFLIEPLQFKEYYNPDYLVFYSENQGVCIWAIKKEDVFQNNPPVYENYGETEWFLTADTVYQFLFSMAHLQAVMSKEFSNGDYRNITAEQANIIANSFCSKGADSDLYTGVKFYGNHDDTVIAVINNNEDFVVMYSSDHEVHFEEVQKKLDCIL